MTDRNVRPLITKSMNLTFLSKQLTETPHAYARIVVVEHLPGPFTADGYGAQSLASAAFQSSSKEKAGL